MLSALIIEAARREPREWWEPPPDEYEGCVYNGTLTDTDSLTIEANSKPGWSEAFGLLGCACNSMPALESICIEGRKDDASVAAFFDSLIVDELDAFSEQTGLHTETRWLFPLNRLSLNCTGYGLPTVR